MTRNRYIATPGRIHIAVDDPVSPELSLETACGRGLRDGLTLNSLETYERVYRCRTCFTRAGEDPAPGKFPPPNPFPRRRRGRR